MATITISGVEYKVTEKFRSLIKSIDPFSESLEAVNQGEKALLYAEKVGNPEYLALAHDRLALAFSYHSPTEDHALSHFVKALEQFEALGDSEGVARVLQNYGNHLIHKNDVEAYKLIHRAVQVARSSAPYELPRALMNAANITYEMGQADMALEYLNQALPLAERSSFLGPLVRVYCMLGGIQSELGQHTQGIELVKKSIDIARKMLPMKLELLKSQYRLCFVHAAAGQFDQALNVGKEAIEGYSEMGSINGIIVTSLLLADICFKQGDLISLRTYYELASQARKSDFQPKEELEILRCQANILESEGNVPEACKQLLKALDLAKTLKQPKLQIPVERSLFEIYKRSGDNSKALQHHEDLAIAEKQHLEQLHASKMQIMLVDREFEKKEYELALERQQIARLESDLAEKVVQISDQVELFSTLRRDLESIVKKIPPDSPAAFDLKKRLRSLPQGVDWKQVEEHFRSVHPRFQLNLSKEFPSLSQTEVRLCTLLRLNLSSRDISRLLSLSIRTIENHRYNIRKKLGLSAEQDIAQYLAKM